MRRFWRQSGFSLLEVMVAVGALGIVSLAVLSINSISMKSATSANVYHQADMFRKNIIAILEDDDNWEATINHAVNGTMFDCLKNDTTSCASKDSPPFTGSTNAVPGTPARRFAVVNKKPTVIYNPIVTTAGFDNNGALCNTFGVTPALANSCPFRLELSWQAICKPDGTPAPPVSCNRNNIEILIEGQMLYNPKITADKTKQIPFNYKRYGFELRRGATGIVDIDFGEGETDFMAKWLETKKLTKSSVMHEAASNGYIGIGMGTSTTNRSMLTVQQTSDAGADGFTIIPYVGYGGADYMRLYMDAAGAGRFRFDNGTEPLTVTRGGNVGIGTATPGANLHLNNSSGQNLLSLGTIYGSTVNDNALHFLTYTTGNNYLDSKTSTNGFTYFRAGHGTEAAYARTWMTVQNSTGNVTIGAATTPAYKLDVNGEAILTGYIRTRGNGGWYNETFGGGWYMIDSTYVRAYGNKAVYTTGPVYGASFNPTSDRTLKKNIVKIDQPLWRIGQLNGMYFNWIDPKEPQGRQVGVIAQEVQKVFPELVTNKTVTKKLAVNYTGLIPALIAAVNELKEIVFREIAELKEQVAYSLALVKRVEHLEHENRELRDRLDALQERIEAVAAARADK